MTQSWATNGTEMVPKWSKSARCWTKKIFCSDLFFTFGDPLPHPHSSPIKNENKVENSQKTNKNKKQVSRTCIIWFYIDIKTFLKIVWVFLRALPKMVPLPHTHTNEASVGGRNKCEGAGTKDVVERGMLAANIWEKSPPATADVLFTLRVFPRMQNFPVKFSPRQMTMQITPYPKGSLFRAPVGVPCPPREYIEKRSFTKGPI